MALTFAGTARHFTCKKKFHGEQAVLSSNWLIISRGSLKPSHMLTLPALLLILVFHWTKEHKQWFWWNAAVKSFFIRWVLQKKCSLPKLVDEEMRCVMKCLFLKFHKSVWVQPHQWPNFISVLGNYYMLSIRKKCPSLLSIASALYSNHSPI